MKSRIEVIRVSEDEVRLSGDAFRTIGQLVDKMIVRAVDEGGQLGKVVLTFDDHDHEVLSGGPLDKSVSDLGPRRKK